MVNPKFAVSWCSLKQHGALSSIVSGNLDQKCAVVDGGAVPLLINLLESTHTDVCEQAILALSNITMGTSDYGVSPQEIIKPLLKFISPDTQV